jgi:hypothetical protein
MIKEGSKGSGTEGSGTEGQVLFLEFALHLE